MARKKSLNQLLEELIDQFIPEIRDAFLKAIRDISSNVILKDLIEAIELGDIEKAFRALGMSEAALRPITETIERAFETGGITTGSTFPKYLNTSNGRAIFRFDVRNSRAERILRDQSSELVSRIIDDTRNVLRNTLSEGVTLGNNPRKTALDIVGRVNPITRQREGGFIGLTPNQERWVASTRNDLVNLNKNYFNRKLRDKRYDKIVMKAINENKSLTNDQIEKLVSSYKNRALKYRGDVIGRTETIQALNKSKHEAINQAVDTGAVKQSSVKREWDSAGDKRTRETHVQMDGQIVGLDEPFTFPDGSKAMFPGDGSLGAPAEEIIQCRCVENIKIDWLEGVE